MNNIEQIIEKIKAIAGKNGMLEYNGGILYSSKDTLKKGDIYFMGYNPGGLGGAGSIEEDIKNLSSRKINAYLDEEWEPNGKKCQKGEAPLQKRVRYFFEKIDIDIKDVCSTNLIFAQSRNAGGVSYPDDADKCWKVHEYLIKEVVKPKTIICMGNGEGESAYAYLWSKYSPNKEESITANHGSWRIKAFQTEGETPKWVIGLPHFSYYELKGKQDEEKIIEWIMTKLR